METYEAAEHKARRRFNISCAIFTGGCAILGSTANVYVLTEDIDLVSKTAAAGTLTALIGMGAMLYTRRFAYDVYPNPDPAREPLATVHQLPGDTVSTAGSRHLAA